MIKPKGLSLIVHQGEEVHCGEFVPGCFSDNNHLIRLPVPERTGWGFKIDIFFSPVIRPLPRFWDPEVYLHDNKKTRIAEVMYKGMSAAMRVFGPRLYYILREKKKDWKHPVCNPWKAKYSAVLRIPTCLPLFFVSLSTPWKSGYFGMKTYDLEPFSNDESWSGKFEQKREGRVACPSITIRSNRR
jgi:hypothetical protein